MAKSVETIEAIHDMGCKLDDMLELKKAQLRGFEAVTTGAVAVVNRLEEQLKSMKDELSKAVATGATPAPSAELTYQYLQRLLLVAKMEVIAAEKTSAMKMGESAALTEAVGLIKKIYDEASAPPPAPVDTIPPEAMRNPLTTQDDTQNIQKKEDQVTSNKKLELSRKMRDARRSGKNKTVRELLNEERGRQSDPPPTEVDEEPVPRATLPSTPGT